MGVVINCAHVRALLANTGGSLKFDEIDPRLRQIVRMREIYKDIQDPTGTPLYNPMYSIFLSNVGACVYGVNHFKKMCTTKPVSQTLSISDEAFALLALLNSWDKWVAECDGTPVKDIPGPLFTKAGPGKGGAAKGEGWQQEGIDLFNLIGDTVAYNRKTDIGEACEAEWRRVWAGAAKGRALTKRKACDGDDRPRARAKTWMN